QRGQTRWPAPGSSRGHHWAVLMAVSGSFPGHLWAAFHGRLHRSDNGPEFISEAMADWAGTRTGLSYIPPGSPWRNGYVESFNSRIRDECLNINSFYSLLHAQVIIGDWKDEYNHHRRHSSLGYLTPAEYARQCTHQMETDDSQNVRTE
ncbi:integrase core domain-containing protein, partial [Micrococcus luteus]|uniref:integrase core domain-containing protein n=1 Tax=Micrococcus luteus TaxID=1270 RepID=UPI00356B67B1